MIRVSYFQNGSGNVSWCKEERFLKCFIFNDKIISYFDEIMVQYVELRVSLFHIHAIHRDMQKFRAKGPYSELTFRGKFRSTFRGASKASIHSQILYLRLF